MAISSPSLQSCVEELKQKVEPNLDAFVLKFELNFITLLFHPESEVIVAILPQDINTHDVQINDFFMECSLFPGTVNISFQMRSRHKDGFDKLRLYEFDNVQIKMHQIRAIV